MFGVGGLPPNAKATTPSSQRFGIGLLLFLTVCDAEPALVVEPDVGVDDVRAEARVDGRGGPLALEVADDLLPRAAYRRGTVRAPGGGRRRGACKNEFENNQLIPTQQQSANEYSRASQGRFLSGQGLLACLNFGTLNPSTALARFWQLCTVFGLRKVSRKTGPS